jgi:hypothetical protein
MITTPGYDSEVWRRTTEREWSWRRQEHTPWSRGVRDWCQSEFYHALINKHVSRSSLACPNDHSHGQDLRPFSGSHS